jgi:phage/plasmid-like protein (TIGR03299 family)
MSSMVERMAYLAGTEKPWHNDPQFVVPANSTIEEWAAVGGLLWKVVPMKAAVIGKSETREAVDFKALVRSDTGKIFTFVTNDYKVHQNSELLKTFEHFIASGDMTLETMGSLQDGAKIFASARLNKQLAIPARNGKIDVHDLYYLISTGHTGGYATQADLTDVRAVCYNTLTMGRTEKATKETRWRRTHLGTWNAAAERSVREFIDNALGYADTLESEWTKLYTAPMDRLVEAAFYSELFQPDLYNKVIEETQNKLSFGGLNVSTRQSPVAARTGLLDSIVNDQDARRQIARDLLNPAQFGRTVTTLLQTSPAQPGNDMSLGSMAHAVNAVTYWTDHERGRGTEAAVNSAWFGGGRNDKRDAMNLGLEYAQSLAQISGSPIHSAN